MGRLTLNVLLSFAQFEREVTGERIRDKVAASKAKGLRMGGRPPLGYDIVDGRLAVNEAEAPRVRAIFERYLQLGSVQALAHEGVASKRWITKGGQTLGGGNLSRGALHYLLTNPAYRGVTRHHDRRYQDTHPAIIPAELWEEVQAHLGGTNASQPKTQLRGEKAMLEGLVFDDQGHPMSPVHTKRGATRYRYYPSRASIIGSGQRGTLHRISTGTLEQFLLERLVSQLAPTWCPQAADDQRLTAALARVTLSHSEIEVRIRREALSVEALATAQRDEIELVALRLAFHMRRPQGTLILEPAGDASAPAAKIDRALVRSLVLARQWARQLELGEVSSVSALAARQNLCKHYTARMLPLAYLAPDLAQQILNGTQPRGLTLSRLTPEPVPLSWSEQRTFFKRLAAA